ncbi:hypothetical protein HPB48_006562 [Haemaphysalis longicornis]|uniref:Uncharacterized protein n=1 Tax=Haemaphysalis longicornis TaxID=44386 RepID=A0A9J6GLJ8_HAELO|nr:hypothetical protein HPB48_006562 [Haemaphysalis longicornis]
MANSQCSQCSQPLSEDARFIRCCNCSSHYNLGQECSRVAESTYASMGAMRDKWKCKQCRVNHSSQAESDSALAQLSTINEKLALLQGIKERVDSIVTLEGKLDELLSLKLEVEQLHSVVSDVQSSLDTLYKNYVSLQSISDARDSKVDTLDAQVRSLEVCVSKQASTILSLQAELNESEQYSRSCNLEIRGLPDDPNEDLAAVITDLGRKLKINSFSPSQVIAVHRLPTGKNKPALVLVKFTSKAVRDE